MMQVIFGSGSNIRSSDQISDCGSDTVLNSAPLSTTILESPSPEVGGISRK